MAGPQNLVVPRIDAHKCLLYSMYPGPTHHWRHSQCADVETHLARVVWFVGIIVLL